MTVFAKWEGQEAVSALRAIRAAAVVRGGKDETRTVLRGVILTDGMAVATDSYCLIAVPLQYQDQDIVLPSSVVDGLEKIKITPRMGLCSLEISDTEKTINVQWTNGTSAEVFNGHKDEVSFPDWRSLTISPDQYSISSSEPVALSIKLLSRVAKVGSELGDRDARITLQHVPNSKSVTVWSIKAGEFSDVMWMQMPMRKGR